MEQYELPKRWRWMQIGEVVKIDTLAVWPKDNPAEYFKYVALENIESGTGQLINFTPTKGDQIKSNKFVFNKRHVLLGKLRPYLNKVFLPNFSGVCATDILPLGPNPDYLTREFLAVCLRSPYFMEYCNVKMEGAKMPRLRTPDLVSFDIPIPPLAEQRRIVARIEELTRRVEEVRGLRREAVGNINDFFTSNISQIFRGNGGWQETTLGEVLTLVQYGLSSKMSIVPRGYPVIRMGNIQGGRVITEDLKYLYMAPSKASKYLLKTGDILINRTNSAELVGKAGLFQEDGEYLFASYLIRLRVHSEIANPAFVNYYINSQDGQAFLKTRGKDAIGQTNINAKQIRQMPLLLPPLSEQYRLERYFDSLQEKTDRLKGLQAETEAEISAFTPALLAKAFRGEL